MVSIFVLVTKAERTRQFIIEKTAPIFNRQGYHGTSLSDLTEATGLTKGSLYGNFKDKDDVAMAAFRYSIDKVRELVKDELTPAISAKDQLLALLDFYARYVFDPPVPGGCPLLNTAVEADDGFPSMRKVVTAELLHTINFISVLLKKGIKEGSFVKNIDVQSIAYTIFCCVEGAIMFSRVERSHEPMDIVIKHCKKIIEQISR